MRRRTTMTTALVLTGLAVTAAAGASTRTETQTVVVAPATPDAPARRPAPAVVYLHGMCGEPENGCAWLADGAASFGWLVCPRANGACAGGGPGASWSGNLAARRASIDDALAVAAREHPGAIDLVARTVLVGFSQGAYLALDLALATPQKYKGLLLIGAYVDPPRAALERAGIERVVFAAGDYDGARPAMQRAAERLAREGFSARWVSLGRVGHTYASNPKETVRDALVWLER